MQDELERLIREQERDELTDEEWFEFVGDELDFERREQEPAT